MEEDRISDQLKHLAETIDFTKPMSKYSRLLRGKQEPIYKAFGAKVHEIWDLTVGLGEDAWILARLGYLVKGFEQNFYLFECLKKAHQQAQLHPEFSLIAHRFSLTYANSFNYLQDFKGIVPNIYLDPMFAVDQKSTALPRKEMQYLRELVGKDSIDLSEWLELALSKVQFKVVIKQPRYAKLTSYKPHSQLFGKAMRYDIYLGRAI